MSSLSSASLSVTCGWQWLKYGVRALLEAGDHCPAVIFSQDGRVGSGRLEGVFRFFFPITDPDAHVYLVDKSSARNIAMKMSWEEFKDFYAKR